MAREARKKVEPALSLYARDPRDAAPEPLVGSYESVADLLRRTREQYGEDLRSVAEALRIRYVHLQAIEEGRFRDLPGSTYALGFVRSYAEFLGLDGTEVVERFKEEVAELNRKTQLVFPTPVPEGKVPGGALILISVVLLGAAYGAWSYLSRPDSTIADLIPPVPEHLQSLSGEDGEAPTGAMAGGAPAPGGLEERVPADPGQVAASRGPASTASELAEPSPGAPSTGPSDAAAGPADAAATSASPAVAEAADSDMAGANRSAMGDADGAPPAAVELGATEPRTPPLAEEGADAPPPPPDEVTAEVPDEAAVVSGADLEEGPLAGEEATPPEPAANALAPADQLDSAAEDSIPAAPQLASRVPGREPQVYGAENADARIVLRARQDSWVQVRDAQDSLLLTRVLRQGDEYRVPNRSGLTLLTGNAGGIEILIDGRRLPPLGPIGAVRRDIALDPEQLAQGRSLTE